MKTIKIFESISVVYDGEVIAKPEGPADLWPILKMDGPVYEEARIAVTRALLCFGKADLSPAYKGHSVVLIANPTREA